MAPAPAAVAGSLCFAFFCQVIANFEECKNGKEAQKKIKRKRIVWCWLLSREKVFFCICHIPFSRFLSTNFEFKQIKIVLVSFLCREREPVLFMHKAHRRRRMFGGEIQDIQSVIKNANVFCAEINQLVWLGHKFKLNLSTTVAVAVTD